MTTSFDPVPEPDDRPATVAPPASDAAPVAMPAAPVPYRPRPSRWAMVFRWWLGLSVVTFFAVAFCVFLLVHPIWVGRTAHVQGGVARGSEFCPVAPP